MVLMLGFLHLAHWVLGPLAAANKFPMRCYSTTSNYLFNCYKIETVFQRQFPSFAAFPKPPRLFLYCCCLFCILSSLIHSHKLDHPLYADDTQILDLYYTYLGLWSRSICPQFTIPGICIRPEYKDLFIHYCYLLIRKGTICPCAI